MAGSVQTCYYLHWLCALRRRHDITALTDIFASSLLLAANLLVEHWRRLMADLEAGRCFSWVARSSKGLAPAAAGGLAPPPEGVAAAVDASMEPSPELAQELQQVGWRGQSSSGEWPPLSAAWWEGSASLCRGAVVHGATAAP